MAVTYIVVMALVVHREPRHLGEDEKDRKKRSTSYNQEEEIHQLQPFSSILKDVSLSSKGSHKTMIYEIDR